MAPPHPLPPPAEQAPADQAPAGQAPTDQIPAGQAPTDQAPAGQAPAKPAFGAPRVTTAPQKPSRSSRPADAATQQRAIAALFLALLSLFGLLGLNNLQRGIYIAAFTLAAGLLALWLSVTSITRAHHGGTLTPRGPVTAIVIGAIGVLLSGILLIMLVAFGKQAAAYSRCISGANTLAAQQACRDQFTHAVESRASGG
jgi:hypothetical protein